MSSQGAHGSNDLSRMELGVFVYEPLNPSHLFVHGSQELYVCKLYAYTCIRTCVRCHLFLHGSHECIHVNSMYICIHIYLYVNRILT